jgi:hypothetical protein
MAQFPSPSGASGRWQLREQRRAVRGDNWTTLNSFESIGGTVNVGAGGQATVVFSNIPQNYKHLQIRIMSKSISTNDALDMQFNSDTGNNYSYHDLFGDGGTTGAGVSAPRTTMPIAGLGPPSTNTNMFGVAIVDILDYTDTNKYKTVRSLSGMDLNGSGTVVLTSNNWRSTSAVSTISLFLRTVAGFGQYSSFALYGIRG